MTPQYLRSPWCTDERRWFQEIATRQPDGARGRIFVIRALPVPDADWPPFLCDERGRPSGYHFCDENEPLALPWGLNQSFIEKKGAAVGRLAKELAHHLREARAAARRVGPGPDIPNSTGRGAVPRILLGFVTEDLEDKRVELRAHLAAGEGLEVVAPDWPEASDDIREAATVAAEDCEGLVQLCGQAAGRWCHDTEGFVGFQIRLFEVHIGAVREIPTSCRGRPRRRAPRYR
jgi:hypothetical protein